MSFASFCCDPVKFKSKGPPILKLHGRVHRKISNIHPADNQPVRKFGQVYIMDAETATHERAKDRIVKDNCQDEILNDLHNILWVIWVGCSALATCKPLMRNKHQFLPSNIAMPLGEIIP